MTLWRPSLVSFVLLTLQGTSSAQEPEQPAPEEDFTALAKKTQNTIADLLRIPIHLEFNSGGGLGDQSSVLIKIEPIIPIHVIHEWNIVSRTVAKLISTPQSDGANSTGIEDIELDLFATPSDDNAFVWGVGPIFTFPTATLESESTGTWGFGPAAAVSYKHGPWVIGALVTQAWPIAHYSDSTKASKFLVEPMVHFNFGNGWALVTGPEITANWDKSDDDWLVPIGGGLSWTTKIGDQRVGLGVDYYRNVKRPASAGDNQVRLVVNFLFPEKKAAKPASSTASAREHVQATRAQPAQSSAPSIDSTPPTDSTSSTTGP